MRDWLILATVAVVLFALWRFFNFVADILEIYFDHYRAARDKREAESPTKGKGSSL